MALRCLLFCSDEGTAAPIREVLAGLGVEGEHCSEASVAVDKVSSEPFQIVIIDWDLQPEAGLLLQAARERKPNERALTLAIVSDDLSVPKALQAGANSILRKPILVNQAKDTLKTARDLLRARQDSAANAVTAANAAQAAAAAAAAGAVATTLPGYSEQDGESNPLRSGEFMQSTGGDPGAHFDTDSEMKKSMEQSSASEIDPLDELEPMAASVQGEPEEASPPPPRDPRDDEPRGLEWYLKRRAGAAQGPQMTTPAAAPAPAPVPPKPELIGFDQTPGYSEPAAPTTLEAASLRAASARGASQSDGGQKNAPDGEQEHKTEAALFAYIDGENQEPEAAERPRFRLGMGAIAWALALATCAVVAAPQAPWHPKVQLAWVHGQHVVHGWLNPQLVTTPQAPPSHENFGRAGDEYKLPVAEAIPDATTDPSQIRVTPVIDPTAKKPNDPAAANQNPNPTAPVDGTPANLADPFQPGGPVLEKPAQENQPPAAVSPGGASGTGAASPAPTPSAPAVVPPPAAAPATVSYTRTPVPQSAPARNPQTSSAPANTTATNSAIPSSLKSQMASMTPDASGSKAPESAMNSIEPVVLPELTERELLSDQPAVGYPASAKGQQGTVILQVLIGRDGSVQDAKFMQGSLAFARAAIDGVKLWKFKPYMMNGRAVSVQAPMTISFKPGQ
jgi:periplasmic protein TonB